MKYEVEQKFRCDDPEALIAKLATDTKFGDPIEQVDRYFAHPSRDFSETDEALRIRRHGDTCVITYKGPKLDAETKTRREIELPLSSQPDDVEQYAELLIALGFNPVADVCKKRRCADLRWEGSDFEIALDEVVEVGSFVEIETGAEDDTLDEARGAAAIAGQLPWP